MAKSTKTFEVQGLKELREQLKYFDDDVLKAAVRKAAKAAMEPVADRARDLVPTDTGKLKDSIKVSSGSTDQGQYNRVGWAAVRAGGRGQKDDSGRMPGNYVLPMHYGSSRGVDEEPFLLDAFEPHAQKVATDFRNELKNETAKGVKKMERRAKKLKGG